MRILSWPSDLILKEVDRMDQEVKQFKFELAKICWHMRGSVSLDDAYCMGVEDREVIGKVIEENLETTKKSGLPFF